LSAWNGCSTRSTPSRIRSRICAEEIKNDGFNVKAVERIVAFRPSKDAADKEAEFINDVLLYAQVTGTPLDVVPPEPGETTADEGKAA
jgi:hypothetical protein